MGRVDPLNTKIADSSAAWCMTVPHLVLYHSVCHAVTVKGYTQTDISSMISIPYNIRKGYSENLKSNYRISWLELCCSAT